jgi:hypothetical protein
MKSFFFSVFTLIKLKAQCMLNDTGAMFENKNYNLDMNSATNK